MLQTPILEHAIEVLLLDSGLRDRQLLLIPDAAPRALFEVGACLSDARRFHGKRNVLGWQDIRAISGQYFGLAEAFCRRTATGAHRKVEVRQLP